MIDDVKDILQLTVSRLPLLLATIFFGSCPSITCLGFFKSIQDSPPAKIGYLSFQSPPKLRFYQPEPLADRKNLLTLQKKEGNLIPKVSQDNADPEDSFPLISYDSDQNASSPVYSIPSDALSQSLKDEVLLPPNDPFVEQDMPEPNLSNTDELMEILESNLGSSGRRVGTQVNFVPPYTLDGGNMIMESNSKYTRRSR